MAEGVRTNKNFMLVRQNASGYPLLRQVGLLIGLAASVTLGIAIAFWLQSSVYSTFNQDLPDSEQFKYTNKIEQDYISSVNHILTPFLGQNGFKAQVKAEVNYPRLTAGNVKKISIAIVVDNKKGVAEDVIVTITPRTEDEIKQITTLVKEAVGFNAQRGDTVNIINIGFVAPAGIEVVPDIPLWEQIWFWPVVKQILAALVIVYIIFGLIKPAIRSLSRSQDEVITLEGEGREVQAALAGTLAEETDIADDYKVQLDKARKLVTADPKIAAQVIKKCLAV